MNPVPDELRPPGPDGPDGQGGPDEVEHEQALAVLLSDLTDQVARGETVVIDQVCQQHPDLAEELRELWGAVLVTDITGTIENELPPAKESSRFEGLQLPFVIGDYELQEEIGRGGMGVVFRAQQISLDREVAVKMILKGRLASESDFQRFIAEATATARLEHPNIVPVYEVDDAEGRPYFSMKYIEGETLAQRLMRGPLPQRTAAEILVAIARAIGAAHRAGILHRDIKPSNIILSNTGVPLISDFGLAKQAHSEHSLTSSGMVVGTPAYMSPEQASGVRRAVGPTSDVYSLGCVLYHALTGRAPLIADSPVELMLMVLEQDPPPPRVLNPNLDRDLEMIVIRCLQKPSDLRYCSADALADDLEAFLHDEPVAARSGRFSQVIARMFRETHHATVLENWGLLWIWHSLALLIAAVLTWGLQFYGISSRWAFGLLWTVGLGTWASVFWMLRRRMGPVTFIERQTAHVWGASMIGVGMLFPLEWLMGLPVLTLSPVLGVVASNVFLVKASMYSGLFYIQAVVMLLTALGMALYPDTAHLLFGVTAAGCFFIPGWKYFRQRQRADTAN